MKRDEILEWIWKEQDTAFELMTEYDSLPHRYGDDILYQAEAYIVHEVGNNPNISVTELAETLKKTKSACSQLVKRVMDKGLVYQIRDEKNRRVYHLRLTPDGEKVYRDHIEFNKNCQNITFDLLSEFSDKELEIHARVQKVINKAYQGDLDRSKEKWD